MRFSIAVIAVGLAVIVFTLSFGFPKTPPRPIETSYSADPLIFEDTQVCNGTTYHVVVRDGVVYPQGICEETWIVPAPRPQDRIW
jgi:hypothetical protein